MDVSDVERIANGLVGSEGAWETLVGGGANVVLRRNGYVAKWSFRSEAHQREVEASELICARAPGIVPELIASGDGVMVMENLGSGPSLADVLIEGDLPSAVAYLHAWVDSLAHLHESLWLAPDDDILPAGHVLLIERVRSAIGEQPTLTSSGLWAAAESEMDTIAALASTGGPTTFSIGDMCPGNQMMTSSGLRFFDLEAAGHFHPAIDLSYLITPWGSCWCAWDIPEGLRSELITRYLRQMSRAAEIEDGLVPAVVLWAVYTVAFLPTDLHTKDRPARNDIATPMGRSVILTRLRRAIAYREATERFPLLVEWLGETLSRLIADWGQVDPLAPAPAFHR